jgi:pyoverdine/dityrosine biosynthesis protein Dit1/AcrR family transcriptional regulator
MNTTLRLRLVEASLEQFAKQGYDETSLQEISEQVGASLAQACVLFPTKEHLALAIYERLANDLRSWSSELPEGTIAERFEATMRAKFALLTPHRRALLALLGKAIDPEARAGVLSSSAEVVRSRVSGVFSLVVKGATDAPANEEAKRLARILYGAHLALIFFWTQDRSDDLRAVNQLVQVLCSSLMLVGAMSEQLDSMFSHWLRAAPEAGAEEKAHIIVERIFRRRRVFPGVSSQASEAAFTLHTPQVLEAMLAKKRLQLILPAFPAKAPNPAKVLGARPDMAERIALRTLTSLLDEIQEVYEVGASLVICSDGGVFADAVGVSDKDVFQYRADLEEMIKEIDPRITMFGLEDAFGSTPPEEARALLLARYALSVEEVRERAARSKFHQAQLDGIHRFLLEDELVRRPEVSKNQLHKQTRPMAYEVVRRSDAWGRLVAVAFPEGLRLSIHPQPDVSEKIGIHLLETEDAWLTPWHGVALLRDERFCLIKRRDAETLGANVIEEGGRGSYMVVSP